MNKKIVLLGLPLVLFVAVLAGISSLSQAHATGYPSGPGTVCLLDSSAVFTLSPPGPCASFGPYMFSGPYPSSPQTGPTELRVGVYVNGSAGLDAFAITLVSNSSILQPAGVDLTGTVLQGTPQVLVECLSDVLIQGTSCSSADNVNTLEFAASSALGQPLTSAPTTGLLFTAIYNIVGSTSGPISIGFQTGCGANTSVSGGVCVTVANGSTSPDSEMAQGATFDNSAGNSVLSWYYELASSNTVTVPLNAVSGNEVNLTATAPNGFPTLGGTTVTFSTSTSPGFAAPNFFGNPTYMCSAFAGTPLSCATGLTLSTSTAGTYYVTVYMSYVGDNCAGSGPCTTTYSLVGTTVIQVNVQAVAWSIDSVAASSPQTLYMPDGPLNLVFTAQSLGGYTGTITYQTNTLSDGGTGMSFSYPPSFVLAAGQTISQTVAVTASSEGTALYQAALITTAPTLANQTSGVLTIHVSGFGISAASSSVAFAAFGSTTDSITLQSLGGFAGNVKVTVTVNLGPMQATCPASLTLTAGGTVSGTCTFSGSVPGVNVVTVTAVGGTNGALTNQTQVQVTITATSASFNIAASPTSITGNVNSPLASKITVASVGGLGGTVSLSYSSSPSSGIACGFSNTGIPLSSPIPSTLSCTSATAGTYVVTVTGTDGSVTNSVAVTFSFTDFSVSAAPVTVTTTAGASASSVITVAPLNGFTGTVTLTFAVTPAGLSCNLPVSTIVLGPATTSTLSCSGPVGTYTVTVTGVSGGLSHTATITFIVTPATPTLTTQIINPAGAPVISVSVGTPVFDQASLSGGYPATGVTGTVSYTFYSNFNCAGSGIPEGTVPVMPANVVGPSSTVIPVPAGLYSFQASYSGDANNNAVVSACESLVAAAYTPSITTAVAPPSIVVGASASDLATLSGGFSPTGTVTYNAYNNAVCTSLVFTSTVPIGIPSAPFTPGATGTYLFVVSYSGDANNSPAATTCGAAGETLVVTPATPNLTTTIRDAAGAPVTTVTVGTVVFDTATLTGGFPPSGVTGTVSYTFYANSVCAPPVTPEGTVPVGPANSVGPSNPVLITVPGGYSFQASYSGDANNNPVVSGCEGLTATNFIIIPSLTIVNIAPGVAGTSTITISPVNGFTDSVALTDTITPSTGLTCTLTPTSITGGSGTSTLSCSGVGGTYEVTVTGTDGALVNSATVTYNVADFTITASPTSLSIVQGAAASSAITVTSLGGFSGTVTFLPINFSPSSHITVTLTPSSVVMSGSAILTVNTTLTTPTGTYVANVTGTSGTLGHSVLVTITVTPQTAIAPFFFVTWLHRVSLSRNHGTETWNYYAFNLNSKQTVYAAITVTGIESGGTSSFTDTTPVFTISADSLVTGSLSQTFTGASVGQTYHFTIAIRWGTTATTNPAALPYIGFYSLSGSFTVTA